jgi:F-type H+-transporting ATPase subunit delta
MAGLASQQALTASTGELLTAAATMDELALSTIGEDLAAVAGVLAREPHLRRLLTETTIAADAKAGMARRLLSGKIGDKSLQIITAALAHRWSSGHDLVEGLRRLSRTALFLQAERAGELDEVEDQLFRFGRIIDANPDLSVVLDDPATPPEGRVELVTRLLDGRAHRLTIDLLTALARDPGGRAYSHGVAELVEQAAERRDKLVAIVTSAIALDADQVTRLRNALRTIYSREIAVHVIVDPSLGGGLSIRVGDEVIDGSVSGRLDAIRQRLAR